MLTQIRRKLSVGYRKSLRSIQNSKIKGPDAVLYKTAFSIFRLALREPSTVLLTSTLAEKRILKLESKGIYIVLNRYTIEITNHNFSYHLELGPEMMGKMLKMFDSKLEALLEEEEAQFKDQRALGLLNVLDTMVFDV